MTINMLTETLVSYHDVTSRVLPAHSGKRIHIATLHRWRTQGLKGVRLASLKLGGRWHTSLEALGRFFDSLSGQNQSPPPGRAANTKPSEASNKALLALREEGLCK
jgi:hypothetical protein